MPVGASAFRDYKISRDGSESLPKTFSASTFAYEFDGSTEGSTYLGGSTAGPPRS